MLPVALGLGLIMLLAVGRGGEMSIENEKKYGAGTPPPPPPGPDKELSPMALERKRIIIQKGFIAAEQKRLAWLSSQRKTEAPQQTKNNIAAYFRRRGVPLEKPDPRVPFWAMPETKVAAYMSEIVNSYTPVTVEIGPAQITSGIGRFPTYVGRVGRPRGGRPRAGRGGLAYNDEYRTRFNTEFNTAYQMGAGTAFNTEFKTDFNTEFNTAFREQFNAR